MTELLGLPLSRVHVSYADELVLELGALRSPIAAVPDHLVGEWRVGTGDVNWELLDAAGTRLAPLGPFWQPKVAAAWEPVLGATVVAVKRNGLRFSSGHVLRVSGDPGWSVQRG
jgi:hypothetical protein